MYYQKTILRVFIVSITALHAQEPGYPFPQKVTYSYGVTATEQDALTEHGRLEETVSPGVRRKYASRC